MDAILYFEKKRGLQTWNMVSIRQEDYLLVRVEADAGKTGWFGRALPESPRPPEAPVSGGWLKRRRERRAAWEEYQARLQAYECFFRSQEAESRRMAGEIDGLLRRANVTGRVSCVYGRELKFLAGEDARAGGGAFAGEGAVAKERSLMRVNSPIKEVWNRYIDWPLFRDYTAFRWMRLLLEEVHESEFILLGFAECIPAVLEYCARGMRELCWYLEEKDRTAEAEEIAEDIYLEYGLAASVRILKGQYPFRKPGLSSRRPVCVLDFTAEERICPEKLAAGSLWIDFLSIEEKEERIRRFAPEVRYLSLKKRWRTLKPKSRKAPQLQRFATVGDRPGYLSEFDVPLSKTSVRTLLPKTSRKS